METDLNANVTAIDPAIRRYKQKIDLVEEDPYQIKDWSDDKSGLPTITNMNIITYLLFSKSGYTEEHLSSYKGLESYKYFISGWVRSVASVTRNGLSIVTAKVGYVSTLYGLTCIFPFQLL